MSLEPRIPKRKKEEETKKPANDSGEEELTKRYFVQVQLPNLLMELKVVKQFKARKIHSLLETHFLANQHRETTTTILELI